MENSSLADSVADHTKIITQLENTLKAGHRVVAEKLIRIKCYEREIQTLEREIALRHEVMQQQREQNEFLANENKRINMEMENGRQQNLILADAMSMITDLQKRREEELEAAKLKYSTVFQELASSNEEIYEHFLSEEEGYSQMVEMKQSKLCLEAELKTAIARTAQAQSKCEVSKGQVQKIEVYNDEIGKNEKLQKQYEALCAEWLELAQSQESQKTALHSMESEKKIEKKVLSSERNLEWQTERQLSQIANFPRTSQEANIDKTTPEEASSSQVEDNIIPSSCSGIAAIGKAKPGNDIKILEQVVLTKKRKSFSDSIDKPDEKSFKMDTPEEFKSFGFFGGKELSDDFQNMMNFDGPAFSPSSSPNNANEGNGNVNRKGFFDFNFM